MISSGIQDERANLSLPSTSFPWNIQDFSSVLDESGYMLIG